MTDARLCLLLLLGCSSCARAGLDPGLAADARGERVGALDAVGGDKAPWRDQRRTDLAPCVPRSAALSIASDLDDGEIEESGFYLPHGEPAGRGDSAGIFMGWWTDKVSGTDGPTWGFFRFAVPQPMFATARIVRAALTLRGLVALESSADWNPAQHALRVSLEDTEDAPAVASGADRPNAPGGRTLLAASLRWPGSGGLVWNSSGDNTVDVRDLLQPLVVKRGGLAAGAHVQLWITGAFEHIAAEVATADSGVSTDKPARLALEWCD